jgi:sterol desaturase/sphingolipid hydroxylase (fatty acid hydroxylase superfamily)
MTILLQFVGAFGARVAAITVFLLLGLLVEYFLPVPSRISSRLQNCLIGLAYLTTEVAASVATAAVISPRWGFFSLFAAGGKNLILAALFTFSWLAMRDFFYYWFHRLQHASPILWAEHAVHHSEEHLNVTTGLRHHWLEMPLFAIFVTLPLAALFRPPLVTVGAVSLLAVVIQWGLHLNARIGFGKLNWLLASPQSHRIHHSIEARHIDRNFAQFFVLWDILFRTYYVPEAGEFPDTGLASGERVCTFAEASVLPFRQWRSMLTSKR